MKTLTKDVLIQSGDMDVNIRFKSDKGQMMYMLRELRASGSTLRMRGVSI